MSEFIAALPMYDWPEVGEEVDAEWAVIRDRLRASGLAAPERLTRCNGDMPPVPGGVRDGSGRLIAPDPAILPPDEFDLHTLWRHPKLLLSQTCWGPLETSDLAEHVQVIGQPDYSAFPGGQGAFYSSVIVMRTVDGPEGAAGASPSETGTASLLLDLLRGTRLAYNAPDSMSGYLALKRDLEDLNEGMAIFSGSVETGSHRASALAVADRAADVAALDCRSWSLFRRFCPEAWKLSPVGWTSHRKGLPHICAADLPLEIVAKVRAVLAG